MDRKYLCILGLSGLTIIGWQSAHASSDFNSFATLTYSIDSIQNKTGLVNDFSGLTITGGFTLDSYSSYVNIPLNSNGSATPLASISDDLVDPVTGSYSKSLSVNGSVTDGSVDSYYYGLFNLLFQNQSVNEFDIQVTLSYELSASVNGQNGNSAIQLDFANELGDFNSGVLGYAVYQDLPGGANTLADSAVYKFTLGSVGGTDALYAGVGISGNIEASPVPLPSAIWLFGTALGLPVVRRLKRKK